MNSVAIPWLGAIGIISYRTMSGKRDSIVSGGVAPGSSIPSLKNVVTTGPKRPPLPSELLATVIVFGTCSIIADRDERVGTLLAWGFLVAMTLSTIGSGAVTGSTNTAAQTQNPPNPPFYPNPPASVSNTS